MFEKMTPDDLLRLTSIQDGPCISIYIPAMPSKTLQVEYEALVRRAAYLLSFEPKNDLRESLLKNLYAFNPAEHLASREQGIAIFVNKHQAGYYLATHELPSKAVVAETFHLKPLLDDLQQNRTYNILVISADEAVLLNCTGGRGTETHTFLFHQGQHSNSIHWKHQDETETSQIPHLKSHLRGRGLQDNQFKKKSGVKLFLRWIEAKISKENGYKTFPLLVFTNEALFHAYKEISTHPHLTHIRIDSTKGVPRMEALIHQANLQIQKDVSQHKSLSAAEVESLARKKMVIDDLVKISRAALNGKVKTLFLRDNIEIWGQLHRKSAQITFHEKQLTSKDDDILDDIACEVIRHGGEVIVLTSKDMPSPSPAAAILSS